MCIYLLQNFLKRGTGLDGPCATSFNIKRGEEGRGKGESERGEAFSRLKKGGKKRKKRGGKKNSHASLRGSIFVEQRKPRKKPSLDLPLNFFRRLTTMKNYIWVAALKIENSSPLPVPPQGERLAARGGGTSRRLGDVRNTLCRSRRSREWHCVINDPRIMARRRCAVVTCK